MTPFEAYGLFLALKQHFTTSYDYHKYNGKVKTSVDSFLKRRDTHCFRKLAQLPDPKQRIIACMVANITWINDVVSDKGAQAERNYQKVVQAFSYALKTELDALDASVTDLIQFKPNATYPLLASMFIANDVSMQLLIVFDDLLHVFDHWDDKLRNDILWETAKERISKYRPFFVYDKDKIKRVFLDWARENR